MCNSATVVYKVYNGVAISNTVCSLHQAIFDVGLQRIDIHVHLHTAMSMFFKLFILSDHNVYFYSQIKLLQVTCNSHIHCFESWSRDGKTVMK